jgi:hypothetical protein
MDTNLREECQARPHVKSIRVTYGEPRKKPKAGDRRTTKAHGVQIRVQSMARDWQGRPIGRIVSNGRPCYDWRAPCDLDPWDHYLLTVQERVAMAKKTSLSIRREIAPCET